MFIDLKIWNLILEKNISISDSLSDRLTAIHSQWNDPIAAGLLKYLKTDYEKLNIDSLDIADSDYISYIPVNKTKPEKTTIGRIASKLGLGSNQEIEIFVNRYKAYAKTGVEFKLLETEEDILWAFLEKNCSKRGTISQSCMNDKYSQEGLKIYAKIGVKILVLVSNNIVIGRAVVWDKIKFMDRVYYEEDHIPALFIKWAKDRGYEWKKEQSTSYGQTDKYDFKWPCKLRESDRIPFMDTLIFYYETKDWSGLVSKAPVPTSINDILFSTQNLAGEAILEDIIELSDGRLEWGTFVLHKNNKLYTKREWTNIWGAWIENSNLKEGKPLLVPTTIKEWIQLHWPEMIIDDKIKLTKPLNLMEFMKNSGAKHDIVINNASYKLSLWGDINFSLIEGRGMLHVAGVDLSNQTIRHDNLDLVDCGVKNTVFFCDRLRIANETPDLPKKCISTYLSLIVKNKKVLVDGNVKIDGTKIQIEKARFITVEGDWEISIKDTTFCTLTGVQILNIDSCTSLTLDNCLVLGPVNTHKLVLKNQELNDFIKYTKLIS